MPMEQFSELMTPAALLDYDRLTKNIERMAKRAKENNLNLRPHIKTHKCIEIGKIQIERGAKGITVSTLDEAEVFADAGFNDITYAVPLSKNKIRKALDLASRISLKIIVDNPTIIDELDRVSYEKRMGIDVLLKVDCGLHRCGVNPDSPSAVNLARAIVNARYMRFAGILTHAGHSYAANDVKQIKQIAEQEQQVMVRFARLLKSEGFHPETVSIGSTPTVTLADSFHEEITEVRPGNYVFYDYTQAVLGTCKVSDCALTVLASVVGTYPDRIVIDAGATALSKDQGPTHITPNCGFGQVIVAYEKGVLAKGAIIKSITQEHGTISVTQNSNTHFRISDMMRILPNHSCLTANLFNEYIVLQGGRIKTRWRTR